MKELVVSLTDEDLELLNEEFESLNARGVGVDTLEECLVLSAMTHCRTMKVASSFLNQVNGFEDELEADAPIRVGVLNMPVHLNDNVDKEEFSQYLSDVLNKAIEDFNNQNNGPIN